MLMAFVSLEENHTFNQIIIKRIIDLPARRMTALKPNFRPVERRGMGRLFLEVKTTGRPSISMQTSKNWSVLPR